MKKPMAGFGFGGNYKLGSGSQRQTPVLRALRWSE
jgi:hypothetical protein